MEGVGTLSRFSERFLPTVDDAFEDSALACDVTVEVDASAGFESFSASCHLLKTSKSSSSLTIKRKQRKQIRPDLETFSDSGSPNSVSRSLMLFSLASFFWNMDRAPEILPFIRKLSLHKRQISFADMLLAAARVAWLVVVFVVALLVRHMLR